MSDDFCKLPVSQIEYAVSVDEVARLDGADWGKRIIGQPRALEALSMGTAIRAKGYNVFVTGASGTGRRTAVMQVLTSYQPADLELFDLFYVYNFSSPHAPLTQVLPAGQGRKFRKELHTLVENIKKLVVLQTESLDFKKQKDECSVAWEQQENARLVTFEAELAVDGFQVVQLQGEDGATSTDILPLVDGAPVPFDDLQAKLKDGALTADQFESLRERYLVYMDRMRHLFVELKRGRNQLDDKLETLRRKTLRPLVHAEVESLAAHFGGDKLHSWLQALEQDVLNPLYMFAPLDGAAGEASEPLSHRPGRSPLSRYGANLLNAHSDATKVPMIFEANPTPMNLFGTIEQAAEPNADSKAAYLKIRAGSLVRASGGFLVIQAEDLMQDEDCWHALKRVLRTGRLEIQAQSGPFGAPVLLKPEPLEVDVKVVIIGGEMVYDMLYQADPDFKKLFKINAEFDATMPRNDETLADYIAFIRKITREEELREASADGIAAAIEYGIRLADHRQRLSTCFSRIADLLREADYRAAIAGSKTIDAEAVNNSLQQRTWLANLPEEKLADMIVAGEIILMVAGSCVGRVNGLAVHDRGYFAFGLPAVISAQVSPGESGVINIEGESGLSGEIYDKAVMIVEGFLRSRYSRSYPLAVAASICFEQSYTAVEGDSASSTAVYALLSAIAGVPLRQDIAVTGSVNQMGQVQPVGGVTEKVEGFFHICQRAGFTGHQGVMLPRQNIVNLVLSPAVMQAIRDGSFSIYAVGTIDEGLQVLTGIHPGKIGADGQFEPGSFNAKVSAELLRMSRAAKDFSA